MSSKFSWKDRLQSFKFAFSGLRNFLRDEHNARIHVLAAVVAIIMGIVFPISDIEWMVVVLVITMVFVAELFNTAIEYLCDHITPESHPEIKRIKDLAAGGVLVSAVGAAIIGGIIFIPKVLASVL